MKKFIVLMTLLGLALSAAVVTAAPSSQEQTGEAYIVQADDWLSKIAEKFYGDLFAYPTIVEATNARAAEDDSFTTIENPDLIEVGQKVWIPAQAQGATPARTSTRRLTTEQLRNALYQGIYDEPVQLAEGSFDGEPFVEGGASRPTVRFVETVMAFGDLNGDGYDDAAVFLAENSSGSGVFIFLAAVIDQEGQPINIGTALLGDRVELKAARITDGEIKVDLVTQGPDDPFCCPTLETTDTFRLEGDRLVWQSDFVGIYLAMLPAASSPGREIMLHLNEDQTVELSTDFLNGEPPIVETGSWQDNGDGTATVMLTGRPDGTVYETPVVITFQLRGPELTAVEYDVNLYGSEGLRLTKR